MSSPQSTPPPLAGTSAGLAEYLKRAFLHRWNLLLFTGGLVAAGLTPVPDALVPMVLAVEVAYLGGLVAHPPFREAVGAQIYRSEERRVGKECRSRPAPPHHKKT